MLKLAAAIAPNLTEVAPLKKHPEMLTLVPPATDPPCGLTPVTIGAPDAEFVQVRITLGLNMIVPSVPATQAWPKSG
jgi:hypothetical protein